MSDSGRSIPLLTVNYEPQVFGHWLTFGNAPGSVSVATPTSAPATTVGAGGVTLPLSNGTVPVADCAQLGANGGSFALGGYTIVYEGRSASSGPGNATGAWTFSLSAQGTYPAGTALGNVPIGFFPYIAYQDYGDWDGRPVPGSVQAGGAIAAFKSPTVNDSAQCFSTSVSLLDPRPFGGVAYAQHFPAVSNESDASIYGANTMPDGYSAALVANGSRHTIAGSSMVKNAIGYKLSLTVGQTGTYDFYDGIYQGSSVIAQYGTLNAGIVFPVASIVLAVGATPPTPTALYPIVSARVGANSQGIGGTVFTYTGVTVNGDNTVTLTGVSGGSGTYVMGARVATGGAFSVNVQDPIITGSGLLASLSGYDAAITMALKGAQDSDNSMFVIQGPSNTDTPVAGGLVQLRLIAGAGQTAPIFRVYDSSNALRFYVTSGGVLSLQSVPIILAQSGTTTTRIDPGYLQMGATIGNGAPSNQAGPKISGGNFSPDLVMSGTAGDAFFNSAGAAGQWLWECTTGGAAGVARWTAKL